MRLSNSLFFSTVNSCGSKMSSFYWFMISLFRRKDSSKNYKKQLFFLIFLCLLIVSCSCLAVTWEMAVTSSSLAEPQRIQRERATARWLFLCPIGTGNDEWVIAVKLNSVKR